MISIHEGYCVSEIIYKTPLFTKTIAIASSMVAVICIAVVWQQWQPTPDSLQPVYTEIEKPLEAYSFDNLSQRVSVPSKIELDGLISKEASFSAYLFSFATQGKKVSGQINIPTIVENKKWPVVVMIRGYVDPALYVTGMGTKNAASAFVHQGFITVAPDFLGYGESDPEDNDSFAARLEKPVTVLDLIASLKQLPYIDTEHIFLWGHSNGGQIALSILEITSASYPTTLWAPVTKPFPYNILYYTDESDDQGKALRNALANFEKNYDVRRFSIDTYLDRIQAPIQLHQGVLDDAVPVKWSDQFVDKFNKLQETKEATQAARLEYYTYPQADHNLRPNWNTVIDRDVAFFKSFLR